MNSIFLKVACKQQGGWYFLIKTKWWRYQHVDFPLQFTQHGVVIRTSFDKNYSKAKQIFLKNGFPEGIGKTCWFQAGQICVYGAIEETCYLWSFACLWWYFRKPDFISNTLSCVSNTPFWISYSSLWKMCDIQGVRWKERMLIKLLN